MSIRSTASCCQPRVDSSVPRGARTGRGPDSAGSDAWVVMAGSLGRALTSPGAVRRTGAGSPRGAGVPAPHPGAPGSGRADDLLDGPAVAVGIGEEREPPPRERLDLARIHAVRDEVRARGRRVVDHDLHPDHA